MVRSIGLKNNFNDSSTVSLALYLTLLMRTKIHMDWR